MIQGTSSRQIQSVQTGFRIIHLLQNQDGATLNDLNNELDFAKSTILNYMNTLESMGYVVKHDGVYRIGLRFLTHGMAARNGLNINDIVESTLQKVAEEIFQSTWWITEESGRGIFVDKAIPDKSQLIYGQIGKRSYLHTHAPGKAILAQLPEETLQRVLDYHGLPALTTQTTTETDELIEQLAEIREQGYAFSDGEAALGIQSIGVAFEDLHGISHAIGVFGYSHDFDGGNRGREIPSLLRTTVDDLADDLRSEGE